MLFTAFLQEIMPQRRHLTVEEDAEVIGKFTTGCSQSQVGAKLSISHSVTCIRR